MKRHSISAAAAAAALLAGGAAALAAPGDEDRPDTRSRRFMDARHHERPVDAAKGPFFGLRAHSMDVSAEAKNTGCFDYGCRRLGGDRGIERYQLVRTVYDGAADPTECDEVFGIVLPEGVRLRAVAATTRWIRNRGPAGTPFGAFLGDLAIGIVRDSEPGREVLATFKLTGTTGLRPMRGNPDDASSLDEDRCRAPRHDEGFYIGSFNRRALVALLRLNAESGGEKGLEPGEARLLDRSILVGTFEGRLAIEPDVADATRFDYCDIEKATWWFDGVMGYECRDVHTGGGETPSVPPTDR